MENLKLEAIKNAYGEYWEQVKDYVDEYGWIIERVHPSFYYTSKINWEENENNNIRPKSLKGIENNNGWIKIESENDLPKEKCRLFIKDKETGEIFIGKYTDTFFTPIHLTCSHYQEIIYPQPPIY